jgi:hypothetical protein
MAITPRSLFLAPIALLISCSDPTSQPPAATTPPTGAPNTMTPMTPVAAAIHLGMTPLAVDEHGIPRLIRGDSATRMAAPDRATAARMHVQRLAPAWGVRPAALPALESLGEAPVAGGTVVRLRQVVDGMPVDESSGGEVRVLLGSDGSMIAASGRLVGTDTPRAAAVKFLDDESSAIARAVSTTYDVQVAPSALAMTAAASDGSRLLAGRSGRINVSLARAHQAWFPSGETLIPSWVVEAYTSDVNSTSGDAFRTVIAADDGRVLSRVNLTADAAFSYRVFAETAGELHPFDSPTVDVTPNATGVPNTTAYPAYVSPNLVTVDGLNHPNGGGAPPDPWLAASRTETNGNNVQAYTDINAPDGLTFGDFRATVTGPAAFDRTYDAAAGAVTGGQAQQMAGITSLFYLINWLHDFWYDAGFTEPTGNAQDSNLGRGGQDRDAMNAEAQDNANGGSRNNANMSTPADGLPPRMQVFVWDGKADRSLAVSNRHPAVGQAAFGPTTFEVTAPVVLADDGAAPSSDACTPLVNGAAVAGKLVLLDRGVCTFKTKVLNAQNAGAAGVILANNAAGVAPPAMGDDATITTPITIGVLSVLQTEGDRIKADLLAAGPSPVTATLHRGTAGPDLDGSLDATVIAHEFMHYVHHRLSVCNTSLCGAMSEGWADFDSLLVMARPGDNLDKAFPMATYSTASFAADPVYFGIRRAPYSTNQNINPLSFRHMAEGTPLPTNVPFNGSTNNSEVHNSGEVWASMMWEGYVALQKAGATRGISFNDTRLKMQQYVVTGLLIAPPQATPTETRDAILIAARAVNRLDHDTLAQAYARRGFGSCAISPPRTSSNFVGIVESNEVKGRIEPGALAQQLTHNCDNDGVLDAGETTHVTVPIANPGPVALANVTVTLTSAIPGIRVSPASIALGSLDAYSDTTVAFDVELDANVKTALSSDLQVKITSSNGCADAAVPILGPLNVDDKPASSATDTFDALGSVWNAVGSGSVWSHVRETGLDGIWSGADLGATTDASLVSPPLTAGTGALTLTFSHRYSFELTPASGATPAQAFDGGVIEMSTDGGTTWQDVSLVANPGYTNTLLTGGTNPLAGRRAYAGTNPSFPATDNITMFFGTRLAGKTFQLRFRIGSNASGGAAGWQLDDVQFKGIIGTPFPTLIPDTKGCKAGGTGGGGGGSGGGAGDNPGGGGTIGTPEPGRPQGGRNDERDDADNGGCRVAGGAGAGNAAALLLALAVLLRRRRR